MSYTKSICATLLALSLVPAAAAEPVFFDSFESGDMSATNEAGFTWGGNNRTSVVTEEAAVYNNKEIYNVPEGSPDWEPFDGEHSLRFRYAAGSPMTEQRFKLGHHYKDIWITYWVRVPQNFTQGSLNNKFLSLWPNTYDREGTVTWNTRPDGMGGANIVVSDGGVTRGESLRTPLIAVPDDRGRWMHVVARVKSATGPEAHDGIIQFYRRWQNESKYTMLQEKTNADTWDNTSESQGISQGYIFGWANDPYDETTEWLLDKFSIYTSKPSFLDGEQRAAPEPPTLTVE